MTAIAYILFTLGWIIALAGNLRFLVLAYRRGTGWFLACLLLPVVSWIFFVIYFKEAWRPVALSIAGFVLLGIGYFIGGSSFLS